MKFYLKRKDEIVMPVLVDETGSITKFAAREANRAIAPLEQMKDSAWIKIWWKDRRLPVTQGRILEMLMQKGFTDSGALLAGNLGLSLNDYYWICPVDSGLTWSDVNLFDNDFKENILIDINTANALRLENADFVPSVKKTLKQNLSPNSSLQGQLEKSWRIINGKRYLIKGNEEDVSTESINEIIATEFHAAQGYDNYTAYELTHIDGKEYDYGCMSENFVTQEKEFVSAWALISSEKRPNSVSLYEHFINVASHYGADTEQLRLDLEYQILTDYILSNRDRHMNNLGVLRDAGTLEVLRMAPIYDTGKSMFVHQIMPALSELSNYKINSFRDREPDMMKLVKNKDLVDTSKLLPVERIRELYMKDSRMSIERIDQVCAAYEMKIKLFKEL